MFESVRIAYQSLVDGMRAGFGRRAAAIALALLLEGLLVFLLLTLGTSIVRHDRESVLSTFSLDAERETQSPSEEAPAPAERPAPRPRQAEQAPPQPPQPRPETPEPATPPPLPMIVLSRQQMASADIGAVRPRPPAAVRGAVMGPSDSGAPGDTPRVEGEGPNGEPLYAAAWYREPYDDELRGYLSTANGPGWGLIACRTAPDYRVEDCVAVGESPEGSKIARAVLAAAWQFRVRPPRVGGRPKIGEWVRIRIDYGIKRRAG